MDRLGWWKISKKLSPSFHSGLNPYFFNGTVLEDSLVLHNSTLNLTEILIFPLFHWTCLGQLSIQKGFITLVQIYYLSSTSSTKSTCLFAGLQHIQQCRWLNCFHVFFKTKSENGFHNKDVNPQPLSRETFITSQ